MVLRFKIGSIISNNDQTMNSTQKSIIVIGLASLAILIAFVMFRENLGEYLSSIVVSVIIMFLALHLVFLICSFVYNSNSNQSNK